MRYDGKPLFECVQCLMCICRQLPPYGNFTVGADYTFDYIIDAEKVTDDLGETITLPEAVFLSCFENLGGSYYFLQPDFVRYDRIPFISDFKRFRLQLGGNQGICKGHECELSPGKTGIDAEAESDCVWERL